MAAAVDDHLRDGPSGPRGLHDDDGAVAAAAALALLPPKSGGEEAETWATQAVCEHLNKKLDDDKAGRAMRLRDFTLAARALSGTVWKSKFYGAIVLNHRVVLHAIDATPARWRGDAGSSPLEPSQVGRVIAEK